MIQFKCSCCGQLLQLGDEWAGKVAKCPYSGQFMQVPAAASGPSAAAARAAAPPAPARASAPAAPARAPAPVREVHNPFGPAPFVAPPAAAKARPGGAAGAEFGHMSNAVATDQQQLVVKKSLFARWQMRGTLLGAAGGAALGLLFGLIFGLAAGGARGEGLLKTVSIICGGAVLGAGVGGIIGPALLIILPRIKDFTTPGAVKLSTPGAIRGAMYGTARVAAFGALGAIVPGTLRGVFTLLADGSKVGEAVMGGVFAILLMALAWAAAGAILGAWFGAMLGALGGYDS